MSYYGSSYSNEQTVAVRAKESAQMTRRERRKAFPFTLTVFHVGDKPTGEEVGRAVERQRAGNPLFRFWGTSLLAGTTKRISHVPPGYQGIPISYQTEFALETA